MPDIATELAASRGMIEARMVIEGWPYEYVTSPLMAGVQSDGVERMDGLDLSTIRITADASIASARLYQSEMVVEINDDRAHTVVGSLMDRSGERTWLTADVPRGATSITVSSTDGWPASGTLHIGTEACSYAGKTTTSFTGLTRGIWGSTSQAHYVSGAEVSTLRVLQRPQTLRMRRVSLYLYGRADDLAGAGAVYWRGVARSGVAYERGVVSISLDPITHVLNQSLGADIEGGVSARGIYYHEYAPLAIYIARHAGAGRSSDRVENSIVQLFGFFETQEDFASALTTEIESHTSLWTWDADASLVAESLGQMGWQIVYRAGSSSPHYVSMRAFVGDYPSPVDTWSSADWIDTTTGGPVYSVTPGVRYERPITGYVPRSVIGNPNDISWSVPPVGSTPDGWLYLAGTIDVSRVSVVTIGNHVWQVSETDAASRSVNLYPLDSVAERGTPDGDSPEAVLVGPSTLIDVVKLISAGTLEQFITGLVLTSPDEVGRGGMPLLTGEDMSLDFDDLREAEGEVRLARRAWYVSGAVTLNEVLQHELRLRGCYLSIDSAARMSIRRIRTPLITDASAAAQADQIVSASISMVPHGPIRRVVIKGQWDPIKNEHRPPEIRVINADLAAPGLEPGDLEIAPRSTPITYGLLSPAGLDMDVEDAYTLAAPVLGMFGGAYRVVTFSGPIGLITARVGDSILVSEPQLPARDGTMGMREVGLVTAYDWDLQSGRGSMTVLMTGLDTAGYSPGYLVTASTPVGGGQYSLTLDLTTGPTSWLTVGDRMRMIQRDTTTPIMVACTVTAITATTATVDATPPAGEVVLTYDLGDSVRETDAIPAGREWAQSDFLLIAAADRLAVGDSLGIYPAREFAP